MEEKYKYTYRFYGCIILESYDAEKSSKTFTMTKLYFVIETDTEIIVLKSIFASKNFLSFG